MRVETMLVADAINSSADGKINILGQFDQINAANFPARHPSLCVWVRVGAEPKDIDKIFLTTLRLVDPDGKLVFALERPFKIPAPPSPDIWRTGINIIIPISDLVFPSPGDYAFIFEIDGEVSGRVPLSIESVLPDEPG